MTYNMKKADAATAQTTASSKEMTKEILEGFVRETTSCYIERLIDATWENFDEYSQIETDCNGNMWVINVQFNDGSSDAIWDEIDERCCDEGYDIDLYDWCEENDIDLNHMIWNMVDSIVEDDNRLDCKCMYGCDWLMVLYKSSNEIREEEEKVEEFNEWMQDGVRNRINNDIENIKEWGDVTGELDVVCGDIDYYFDCETEWCKYAKEHFGIEKQEAMVLYKEYKDEFITVDDIEMYIEDLAYESDDFDIEENECGKCVLWTKNPYHESIDDEAA